MLYTYPSNKLENLVSTLDILLQASEKPVLAPDVILVQHPGMQHWLSMALANLPNRNICMNSTYPLPVRYFWDLIRLIIGKDKVPDRSSYTREILAWRIFSILETDEIIQDPMMLEPTNYWLKQSASLQASRRFQLSEQLADLFEQYLMFRPDEFILHWEANPAEHWQAKIWQMLVARDPNHPLRLMRLAMEQIKTPAHPLPSSFFIFGVNTLAPIWLDFLAAIAEQSETDIHLLYLNPSTEHWDDLSSEKRILKQLVKEQAKTRADWVTSEEENLGDLFLECGNPLLSGFGLQGQAFVRLLSDKAHYDTQVFSDIEGSSLLARVQQDILKIEDARKQPKNLALDDSLMITSAHSAFREVQGLHDWLLHQFNNDPDLTPKDVLVMCPNVEDYAPFVQAVFARSFAQIKDSVPPLPCSIADRNLKDSDPTVAAFIELLTLPDARFEVSQIISWLRIPAIADKFSLKAADLNQIQVWLSHANIHWGLDAEHKSQWLDTNSTDHFSWKQGLDRLLLGFAYSDDEVFVGGFALLPDVEGDASHLLGRLCSIIEQLQSVRSNLTRARTPAQWQDYLIEQLQQALLSAEPEFSRSNQTILKAINDITEFANRAELQEQEIPLTVIRHVLESAFASPEQTGSQFMTGQITVCSMVPMRSIPFKVIAILGLNDGQFPRNRPPLGFDLMANEAPKLGDRSRRGDDRYLFLEALMSARRSLYLSYQGFDINKNEPRPPSLVLEELLTYLKEGYGVDSDNQLRVLPLQPFSPRNYHGNYPSFDQKWQSAAKSATQNSQALTSAQNPLEEIRAHDLVNFFSHPSKYFANRRLNLFLQTDNRYALEDSEPFALNHLDRYKIQQDSVELSLHNAQDDELVNRMNASSKLPLHFQIEDQISDWQSQSHSFANEIKKVGGSSLNLEQVSIEINDIKISGKLPINSNSQILHWRFANGKGKDLLSMWIHHLLANSRSSVSSVGLFRGKEDAFEEVLLMPIENAREVLASLIELYIIGQSQPLLLNAEFGMALIKDQIEEKHFAKIWQDDFQQQGLCYDPYIEYFWPERPDYHDVLEQITPVYQPIAICAEFSEILPEEETNA